MAPHIFSNHVKFVKCVIIDTNLSPWGTLIKREYIYIYIYSRFIIAGTFVTIKLIFPNRTLAYTIIVGNVYIGISKC